MTRAAFEKTFAAFCIQFVLVRLIVDKVPASFSSCRTSSIPFLMPFHSLLEIGTVADVPAFIIGAFEKVNVIHELYCHVDTLPRKALSVRHAVQPRKNRSALTQQAT